MRAIICEALGPPEDLVLGDLPDPEPGPGEIAIAVETASFNFPDLLIIQGAYQFRADPPFVPGAEGAGTIVALGDGVTGLHVGQRVAAVASHGAFAQRWVVDAATAIPIPDGVSSAVAAVSTMTYGTSYHALAQRARLAPGETLLVLGAAGGVGSAAVELGKSMGATVIAAASTDDKLAFCRELGADATINIVDDDVRSRIKDLTGGRGVDVVYDPVGGDLTETAFRSIAWEGRYLVVGFAAGDIPSLPLNLPLLKGASVMGVFWGSFATRDPAANRSNANAIFDLVQRGVVAPRTMEVVSFDDFARGFELMATRRVTGKIALSIL
jgi:NADPH2:quinone reductase